MSLVKVKEYLKRYNADDRVIVLDESSASVKEAAHALNTSEGAIAKSIAVMINDKPVVIVLSGDRKLDNHKFKGEFHVKARMISYEETETLIGHAPGGVCPFGLNDEVSVYLDESLREHEYVYPACGSSNSAIKLSIDEIEKFSNPVKWVDVGKVME